MFRSFSALRDPSAHKFAQDDNSRGKTRDRIFSPEVAISYPPDLAILSYVDGVICDFVVKIYETMGATRPDWKKPTHSTTEHKQKYECLN